MLSCFRPSAFLNNVLKHSAHYSEKKELLHGAQTVFNFNHVRKHYLQFPARLKNEHALLYRENLKPKLQKSHMSPVLSPVSVIRFTSLTFRGPCIVIYSYNKRQRDALFLTFILIKNSTCFGQIYCPSSGVLILYLQQ